MGLFDAIFGRKKAEPQSVAYKTLTAYQPVFRTWGGQIYECDMVRSAVDAHARHASKLSYQMNGTARTKLYTQTRSKPNPWMTWSAFLERCVNIYNIQNNLFIVPILDQYGEVSGYFPVLPSECELVEVAGEPWLKFTFLQGQKKSVKLNRVGIVVRHQLKDDLFGEKNTALAPTMELESMVNQGIAEGVKNAATFRFMAQLNSKAFDEDLRKERQRFDKNNFQGESGGLLLFGNQFSNIQQIRQEGYKVDPEQKRQIKENVLDYFGVSENVLQNKALGDELDAFFNGAIEPFSIKLSEAMTNMVFSQREINGGNSILFTANRLQYMPVAQKISMVKELGDRGFLMIDEGRELFNYAPLPDGKGQHAPIRGEYYMADEGKQNDDKTGGGSGDDAAEEGENDE
jgi:HK97 family phage portal protein